MLQMNPHLLRAERLKRGWTQAKVAEVLGVDSKTVGRWERGKGIPYPYFREQICLLFGKTAEQLGLLVAYEDITVDNAVSLGVQCRTPDNAMQASFLADPTISQSLQSATSLVGRHAILTEVKERLLAGENVAVDGLPGIGKTALATVLAMDPQVWDHFCDGILWAGLGPRPNVLGHLMRWSMLLGVVPSQIDNINSREDWGRALRAAIGTRRLLLIIDDACTVEDALALQVGGSACAYVVTTHFSEVALAFGQEGRIAIAQLEEMERVALLSRFVPELIEDDPQGAHTLVQVVGGLPLTLTLIGSYLASQSFPAQSYPLHTTLALLRDTEERLHASMPWVSEEDSARLEETMPFSLHAAVAMCDQQLSPQAHAALWALASFLPKLESFSQEVALTVTQEPVETLDALCDAGLLEVWGPRRYLLHQAVADSLCAQGKVSASQKQRISSLLEEHVQGGYKPNTHLPERPLFSPLPPHQNKRRRVLIGIILLVIVIAGVVSVFALLSLSAKNNATIPFSPALGGVCYQADVQDSGWQSQVCDGAIVGTTGQSLRLEAIKISLVNAPPASHICYQAHVQNVGWQSQVCDGDIAGTTGQSLRLEAIKISLVNAPPASHICYQAHVQNIGWQNPVCDGDIAGTTGQSLRLEAIKIIVSH
jgi:transcriptional regulator with XRE-family HTH domain